MFKRLRWKIGVVLAVILGFLGFNAFSEDNNLSWTAPTTLENGNPIPDLAGYNVYYSFNGGLFSFLANVATLGYLHANQLDGEHCYYVTSVRGNGLESVPSVTVCKSIDTLLPNPPSNVRLQ